MNSQADRLPCFEPPGIEKQNGKQWLYRSAVLLTTLSMVAGTSSRALATPTPDGGIDEGLSEVSPPAIGETPLASDVLAARSVAEQSGGSFVVFGDENPTDGETGQLSPGFTSLPQMSTPEALEAGSMSPQFSATSLDSSRIRQDETVSTTAADLLEPETAVESRIEFTQVAQTSTPVALDEDESDSPEFGSAGSSRWYVQGAFASTLDDDRARRFGLVGAAWSQFFANSQSINFELNGLVFDQTGDDAVGLNVAVLHRWHFYRQRNWSLYIDGGAGIIGTTNDVPSKGSSFNFTPQAGGGATVRINDTQRLMVGLRWHHISNANLYEGNPGRDSVMAYVGLNMPR